MSQRETITLTLPDGSKSAPFTLEDLQRLHQRTEERDPLFHDAACAVIREGRCSTSWIQRTFAIGYNRASRIVEQLEEIGIVSAADHVGKRTVTDVGSLRNAIEGANQVRSAVAKAHQNYQRSKGVPPMKHDPDFAKQADNAYGVTADELRQFIERFERFAQEKQEIADQQKEVMAEAKGRGYDTKVLRKLIALRKREPDDVAEEEALLEMYKSALGMS
ncbi:hypothetical protein ATO8_18754 [Roseivivax marinus]|uniref:FtsK gamma domain-containing protein n=2 Tax=Roseivivax marinus TaxID=1379903 RepID=W4HFA8_9RHOB|nr:hypothetical protein ATO8_18754 [Roseivivax marinus]